MKKLLYSECIFLMDVSDSTIWECIIFVKSVTDRTEQEKRGKDCAHTSQREKDCAPRKKTFKLGLLTHLGVTTRLARRAFAIHLAHVWTIAKPCLETLDHRSQHASSLLRIRPLETRQDEISTDLLEDSDDAGTRDVQLTTSLGCAWIPPCSATARHNCIWWGAPTGPALA